MTTRESETKRAAVGQKNNRNRRRSGAALMAAALSAASVAALTPRSALAASDIWDGSTDATWATSTNWLSDPAVVPGTGDTATFNSAGNGNIVIDLGGGVTINTILFDTANAAAYTIGAGGAGAQTLTLDAGGAITRNGTVTASQIINANLAALGDFTVTNSATGGSLTIAGAISGGALTKLGAGTLTLSGANTYTGGTTITGILNAANNSALGTGGVTISAATGNQLRLADGINIGNALTINGGGILAQGALYVSSGAATYSGPIAINAAANAGGHFATGGQTSVLTIAGDNTITSSAVPLTIRNGIVVYSGAQNYTGGTTLANSGAMIQFAKTASMPASGTVTLGSGTTLAVNAGGAGEFAVGTGAGTIGGILAGLGGQGAPVSMAAGSSLGIDTTNAVGNVTFADAFTSANNVGLLKLGTGTLELTNGGAYAGNGIGGFPFIARRGTVLLNGGTHTVTGEAVVGGTFGTAAGAAGYDATLQVDAGAFDVSTWLSIGRGNGTGGVSSNLVINNNATVTAQNLSAGFNAGNGANLPKGSITLNNNAVLTVTGANFNLAESNGSDFTLTVNDSATVNATAASVRIGQNAGKGALIMNGGTFNASFLDIGTGSNNQQAANGTVTVNTGATLNVEGDLRTGFAGNSQAQATVNLEGGEINVATNTKRWMIIGRWDATNSTINVNGGALNLNTNTDIRFAQNNNSGTNVFNLNGGSVTSYSDNKTTANGSGVVDLMLAGSANTNNTFNLNGGTLTVRQVMSTNTTNGTRTLNFNGGTLRATGATSAFVNFGTANARANVRNNGAIIDSNGYDVTIPQALLHSDIVGDNAIDGGLTKTGAGMLTLTGANTYTGPTSITGGVLHLSSTGDINTSSGITVNGSGAKLLHTSGAGITPAVTLTQGSIDATGSIDSVSVANLAGNTIANGNGTSGALAINNLTFNGAATLDLTTASTSPVLSTTTLATNAAGQIVVNASNENGLWLPDTYNLISYSGTLGGAGFSAFTKGTIEGLSARQMATLTNPAGFIALSITGDNPKWTGAFSSDWSTATLPEPKNWQLISGGSTTDYIEGDIVLFDNTASNYTVNVSPAGGVAPTSATFASGDYTVTASAGSAGITGAATLTKSGSGSVALNSANSYTGGTTLSGGTLAINNASAIGTGALTITGGTLDNTSGAPVTLSTANAQNWNGDFTYNGSGDLNMGTGPVALSAQRTVTVNGGVLAVDGAVSGTNVGITKTGGGKLALGGSNTYSGTTIITAGQLEVTGGTTGTLTADIQIGPDSFDDGTLLVSGGTVNANRVIIAGNSPNTGAPGIGTVTQSGGTINAQAWFTVGSGVNTASPGSFPFGTYNNSGGTLNIIGQPMEIANFNASTGIVNLSGTGAINVYNNQSIRLGANANAWDGTFNQDGGTVTFYSDAGTTVGGTGVLRIGHSGTLSNTYTYNLNGGTLTVPAIQGNTANTALGRIFNLNGGTLKAAGNTTNWITGLTSFNVTGGTIDDGGFAATISQVIDGGGTVTKQGSGTLTLTAVNNFGGTVDVTAGTLAVASGGSLSNVNVNGGTLDGAGTINNVTVANNLASTVANGSGTAANLSIGTLTFNGAGTFSLETSNTLPASQVITTTTLAANGAADSVVVDVANASGWVSGQTYNLVSYDGTIGGTGFAAFTEGTITGLGPRQTATLTNPTGFIALEIGGDVPVWTGALSGDWTTATLASPKNWKLQTAGTETDFLTGDQVLFDDTATGTTSVNIADANVSAAQITFNNSAKDYTISSTGGFGIAAGSITKNGTGALTINTANTYAGGTTLNAGTLNVNNASALGTGAVTITGGTLDNTSGAAVTLSTNNAQNWNGNFTFAGTNDLDMGTGAVTLGGATTVNVNAGTLTVGEIRGTSYDLTKQGAGTLILTSTGASGANAGDGSAVALLNVAAGTLQFNRTGADSAGSGDLSGITGLTGSGTVTNGAAVERWMFVTNASDHEFSGTLANGGSGALGFVKRGTATQTLSGANSYTGATTVDAGTLVISGNNSGAGTNTTVNAGNLVLANTSALGAASLVRLVGDNLSTLTYAHDGVDTPYDLTFGTGTNATIVSDRATPGEGINHTLSTQANANGVGGGSLTFTSGANVTSGTGRITLNQFNLGSGFADAVTTLNPTSANVTVGSVKKANNAPNQTLDLGGTTSDNHVTGTIENGTTGAVISVSKNNTSTWTLSGANTYTGTTTVNDGTLRVANNLTTSSAVNVTGGTLQVATGGGSNRVLKTPSVTVSGTGQIDLTDNKLITDVPAGTATGGVYDGIQGLVQTARNGGTWDGAGITSSLIPAVPAGQASTSIGVATGAQVNPSLATAGNTALFAGQTITGASVIAMYTYGGDANLDGLVSGDDYTAIDFAIAVPDASGWVNGDFNYDGIISGDDYTVIDFNVAAQGAAFPTAGVSGAASGVTAVPEPASLSVLGLAAAGLLGRRRRRCN